MRKVTVNLTDSKLQLFGPVGNERIEIVSGYRDTALAQRLFRELGLMHLVAPYLPQAIEANFPVSKPIRKLVGAMYRSEKKDPPVFRAPDDSETIVAPAVSRKRAAVSFSSGKDSLWNMGRMLDRYGEDAVLAVHIGGLNRANARDESRFAERQRHALGFKHFETIALANGSENRNYAVMRSRDMFLAGITVPLALEFGASQIVTEGFAETHITEPFSGQKQNVRFFNSILGELGIPTRVTWRDREEMGVMRDLLTERPEWVPHVCNCFSPPNYRLCIRKSWRRNAPSFTLYDSQCGSCVKCRIVNLGRVLYDPAARAIRENDVRFFLESTVRWYRKRHIDLADMIAGSFKRDLLKACKQHNVPFNPAA